MHGNEKGTPRQEGANLTSANNGSDDNKSKLGKQLSISEIRMRALSASGLVDIIEVTSADEALIKCPGENLHTTPTSKKDCRLRTDGYPSVFCFHSSCSSEVANLNAKVRQRLDMRTAIGATTERRPRKTFTPVPLPDPIANPQGNLLRALFKSGDQIALAKEICYGGTWRPAESRTFGFDELLERSDLEGYQFFRVNPMYPEGTKDAEVSDFRFVLVEMDKDDEDTPIPLECQLGALIASTLPVVTVAFSGNQSLHGIVRVDAETREEYDRRVNLVYKRMEQFIRVDSKVRNPSRLSRFPGSMRAEGRHNQAAEQTLLAVGIGHSSWREYEASLAINPEGMSDSVSCVHSNTASQHHSNTATQQPSTIASQQNHFCSSSCSLITYQLFLPAGKSDHDSVSEGKLNCLWRLARTVLKHLINGELREEDRGGIFQHWHEVYLGWCEENLLEAQPRSRLLHDFNGAVENCKVADNEKSVGAAVRIAAGKPLPPETEPFRDDKQLCQLASVLRELATIENKDGTFYISVRDAANVIGVNCPIKGSRCLKHLVKRGILRCLHPGEPGKGSRKAAKYVYRPLNEPF
jgi:hypothetical protein